MTDQVGFVGDIHGEVKLLEQLLQSAIPRVSRLVFLGDYVNRGRRSREVIDRLVRLRDEGVPATFLAGNHDRAFLQALSSSDIVPFLRIGGAATISSYLREPITDLGRQLRGAVPDEHRAFLSALLPTDTGPGYVAAHEPDPELASDQIYGIFGHLPQRSLTPHINQQRALVDTGCGTWPRGRLTCFLWPSREWFQVPDDNSSSV